MKTGLNFQTCTIINSNSYKGKKLFETSSDIFKVRPGMNFEKANITKLYTAAGYEGVNEVVTVNLSKVITALEANKYYRLDIYLKVIGAEPFIYSTPWVQKGHPFWCDFVAKKGQDATAVADALAKSIKKDQFFQMGDEQLIASASAGTLTLTVQHDYLRFAKVVLVELNAEGDDTEVIASLEENGETIKKTTEGKNAFGTYSYIIQNLRLPTTENLRWTHLHDDETPVIGGIYDQFILEYTAPANNRPLGAVGCEVQSHTLHSFWVLHSLAEEFKSELNKAANKEVQLQNTVVSEQASKASELNTKTVK